MSTNPVLRQMYPIVLPYAAMVTVQLLCLVLIWWKLPDTRVIAAQRERDAQGLKAAAESAVSELRLFSALPLLLGLAVALSQLSVAGL